MADPVSATDLTALDDAVGRARGLPGACYDESFFERERRLLFPGTWSAVAFGASIPDPGDAIPVELAGQPLVAVRQADGTIKTFHNICRHRAMQVVTKPCQKARALICPWHAWAYGIDGELKTTPRIGGPRAHNDAEFDHKDLGLREIRTGRWLDFVLVNLDGKAPDLATYTAGLDELLRDIDRQDLFCAGSWEGSYPGNWKIAVEGAIEDYHLPVAHPEAMDGVRQRTVEIETGPGFAATCAREDLDPNGARALSPLNKLPKLIGDGAEAGRIRIVNLFPTGIIATQDTHVLQALFLPDGPSRTRLEFRLYWPREAQSHPEFDALMKATLEDWIYIGGQDTIFVEHVQKTALIRDAAGIQTRFSPYWEGAVLHFQRMVAERMSGHQTGHG
jgi:choline monooxygenase